MPVKAQKDILRGLGVVALSLILLAVWMRRQNRENRREALRAIERNGSVESGSERVTQGERHERWRSRFAISAQQSAADVVAARVSDFGRKRLEWIRAKAVRIGKEVPSEVEKFFLAMQGGKWEDIEANFSALAKRSAQYDGSTHWEELDPFWPAVLEAYGTAEKAHLWPADKLVEYASDVMGSLRPGMVYVGGTDPGRFVPTLFNETGEGDPHVVLTQNALADARYLDYARELYGDRLAMPTEEVSKAIFEEYVTDARKRLEHDQQFPDEPQQIKPGEKVEIADGKTQVSGQVAVMAINEKLFQWTLQNNPDTSFAIEESFPFRSTYTNAVPLGPIMELRASEPLEAQGAAATVEYWRDAAQRFGRGESSDEAADLKTYSHMATSQANLLASLGFSAEAESTYRLAMEIHPQSSGAAFGLAQFLSDHGRAAEGERVIAQFQQKNPGAALKRQ